MFEYMFKNPFSFKGRIRRLEYNLSILIYVLIVVGAMIIVYRFYNYHFSTAYLIIRIPITWFILAQGAKRCHDVGNSGWYIIIPFYSIILMFIEGDVGDNQYGPDPKGLQATSSPDVLDDMIQ